MRRNGAGSLFLFIYFLFFFARASQNLLSCDSLYPFGFGHYLDKRMEHLTASRRPSVIRIGPRLTLETPVWAAAPMVGQSDAPFRRLCRRRGATLIYTEMFLADRFASEPAYRNAALGVGVAAEDHPLVVQFAANDPAALLAAALYAQRLGADVVDINLGCPQRRAREAG